MVSCSGGTSKQVPAATPTAAGTAIPAFTASGHNRANPTAAENALQGSHGWALQRQNASVAGVAEPFSGDPGGTVALRLSGPGVAVRVQVFRLGWYGGLGGRLMADLGMVQVDPQAAATLDANGAATLPWHTTVSFPVGPNWPSGVYEAKLTFGGGQNFVPFLVHSAQAPQDLLYHTSDFTWQAYNAWDGSSLYASRVPGVLRASTVSLDRPYDRTGMAMDLFAYELPTIRFLERSGYGVDYASDADMDASAALLLCHKAVVTGAHDEYWTRAMRDHLEEARDRGTHLAFLGGNLGYWQIRLHPPGSGSNGNITCHKSTRADPVAATDPSNATDMFQSQAVHRPESALLGVQYDERNGLGPRFLYNLTFTGDAQALFGIPAGTRAVGVMGREWDRLPPAPLPGLRVLGVAEAAYGFQPSGATTLYRAPSGALVFSAGTMGWGFGFDAWRSPVTGYTTPSPEVQAMTARILDAMLA